MSTKFLNQVKLSSTFVTSTSPVIASDDGQTAIQKLQGQIYVLEPGVGSETVFNGIEDASLFSVSYSASTRIFSVTYSAGAAYTVNGVRYAPTAGTVTSVPHANATGLYYLYYDITGTMEVSASPWNLLTDAPIAAAYYNTSNNGGAVDGILIYELHAGNKGMTNATHKNLHTTRGTQLVNGIAASGYTLNTGGSANVNWTTTAGNIADEDIVWPVASQALGGANTYRILYLTGTTASPVWNWKDTAEDGIYHNGTDIYYNQNNAGTWQLTAINANNRWVNYYIVATTAYNTPQINVVMGQVLYTSAAAATAGTFATDIANFGLFTSEAVVLYRITYRRDATYGAPGNSQINSFTQIIQNLVTVGVGGTVSASNVTVSTGSFVNFFGPTDGTVQQCFNDIDANIKGITITGTAAGITGGVANDIPYQTAANTTSFITPVNSAVLVSNGSGVPSMSTTLPAVEAGSCTCTDPTTSSSSSINTALGDVYAAAIVGMAIQTFTGSGTYTPNAKMSYCTIECWGAGGGGGGCDNTTNSFSGGGGGGAGGYSRKIASKATIGTSQTVTIGAYGAGGTAGNNAGGAGGATSVGTLCIANGGSGGGGSTGQTLGAPGDGANPGTGDVTFYGIPGCFSPLANNGGTSPSLICLSGFGSSGIAGVGGWSAFIAGSGSTVGNQAYGYGAGGGGACVVGTGQTARAGGHGAPGYVVITEYLHG